MTSPEAITEARPPKLIRVFELIGVATVIGGLIFVPGFDWADLIFYPVYLGLVLMISRKAKNWARWAFAILLGIGLSASLATIWMNRDLFMMASVFDVIIVGAMTGMAIIQLVILFTSVMQTWIDKPIRQI